MGCRMVGLVACLWLGGCAAAMKPAAFTDAGPVFDPMLFWAGHAVSWGVVENRSGAPTEMVCTESHGTLQGGVLAMHQTLRESDGTTTTRDWRLWRVGPGRYAATANDMIGAAEGQAGGPALHWDWVWATAPGNPLKNVTMHQWMYLLDDGSMMNRTVITKLGVTVAQVTEHFTKKDNGTGP